MTPLLLVAISLLYLSWPHDGFEIKPKYVANSLQNT
jgi:hypothetical protein